MTKREAAEYIIKHDGACSDINCDECCCEEMCKDDNQSLMEAKQWLADHPEEEWQELDLKDYEIETVCTTYSKKDGKVSDKKARLRYRRKHAKKQPSHKEIMTKWWKKGNRWRRVIQCEISDGRCIYTLIDERTAVTALWFVDLESADIPPEN